MYICIFMNMYTHMVRRDVTFSSSRLYVFLVAMSRCSMSHVVSRGNRLFYLVATLRPPRRDFKCSSSRCLVVRCLLVSRGNRLFYLVASLRSPRRDSTFSSSRFHVSPLSILCSPRRAFTCSSSRCLVVRCLISCSWRSSVFSCCSSRKSCFVLCIS